MSLIPIDYCGESEATVELDTIETIWQKYNPNSKAFAYFSLFNRALSHSWSELPLKSDG